MNEGILTSGWLPIAHLLRPQGRRGELLAEILSDLPGLFAGDREAMLAPAGTIAPNSKTSTILLEEHWFPTGKNSGRVVIKFSGCDTITQAEALSGMELLVASASIPPLDPDTFFVGDLIGCTLLDCTPGTGPIAVGTIVDLEFATAPDGRTRLEDAAPLLAVSPLPLMIPETEPTLVPFVRAWLDSVDISARQVRMRLPPGLFDDPRP